MLKKIIGNSTGKIIFQLRAIVMVLTILAAFNLVVVYRQTHRLALDAQVESYTGTIEGETQRIVKLALSQQSTVNSGSQPTDEPGSQSVADSLAVSALSRESRAKIDAIAPELDKLISGLINGDELLGITKLENPDFQVAMEQLQQSWQQLKVDLDEFLKTPNAPQRETLLITSENTWELANEVATVARLQAEDHAQTNERTEIILFVINLIVLGGALKITETIKANLRKTVVNLTTSSTEIATTIAEQEQVASQQAASVNETTTTMDELEASSRNSAEQANAATEAAKHAFQASEVGADAVGTSLEDMFLLEKRVEKIADQIVNLSSQASQISSISQLVIDFANQTNMLALNSSVEAVRAGEHGKGFAVVASEIRKLADQSQQSADKINTLVSDIQKSINSTVMATEEGTKTVKASVQVVQQAEAAFKDVKNAVNQVVMNNQQVSLNLKQQVDAIQQVVDAMDVINQGAQETARGLSQTKGGAEQLNEASLDLQRMV